MHDTLSQVFMFTRSGRSECEKICQPITDALSVILVWQALGEHRGHEVLSFEDSKSLTARLSFRANDNDRTQLELDEQCAAHGVVRRLLDGSQQNS